MAKLKKESVPFAFIYQSNREAGFTLVELAVVVIIIGFLATMGISALNVQQANAAVSATKKNQDTIKDALTGYLGRKKRLPCPAVDTLGGLDATTRNGLPPLNCKTYFGLVPYLELGLPRSVALDGWEHFISYAVSPTWATTYNSAISPAPGGNTTNTTVNAFNVGNVGTITVNTRIPASLNPPTVIANGASPYGQSPPGAVIALISNGLNGAGAYTAKGTQQTAPSGSDETANAIAQTPLPLAGLSLSTLFQREFTDQNAGYGTFDDVVLWLSPNDLLTPLIKDGSMKSPEAQWAEQYIIIKNWAVDQVLSNCTVPALPTNLAIGPWGESVTFNPSPTNPFRFTDTVSPHTLATTALYSISDPNVTLIPTAPTAGQLLGSYSYLTSKCP